MSVKGRVTRSYGDSSVGGAVRRGAECEARCVARSEQLGSVSQDLR